MMRNLVLGSFALLLFISNAEARLECEATCILEGPEVYEVLPHTGFDGSIHGQVSISNLYGSRFVGVFGSNGHPGTWCGSEVTSLSVRVDNETVRTDGGEIDFEIGGLSHTFSCKLGNVVVVPW